MWTSGSEISTSDAVAWSPGIGIRYSSPVGPLRLDIGYNTGSSESLPVVSEIEGEIVLLGDDEGEAILFEYDPFEDTGFSEFLSRLQLHFSIGQAF